MISRSQQRSISILIVLLFYGSKNIESKSLGWAEFLNKEDTLIPSPIITRDWDSAYNPSLEVKAVNVGRSKFATSKGDATKDPGNNIGSNKDVTDDQNNKIVDYIDRRETQGETPANIDNALHQVKQHDDSKMQRRALDFLYHKIVEPRLYSDIQPRPSLVEELMATFNQHVKEDLNAWANSKRQPTTASLIPNLLHSLTHNVRYQTPEDTPTPEVTYIPPEIGLNSVDATINSNGEEAYVITDDNGSKTVVTIDDIMNSLSQIPTSEVSDLLLNNPMNPIEPIERSFVEDPIDIANFHDHTSRNDPGDALQEDDVVLLEREDGDIRLVTVKDILSLYEGLTAAQLQNHRIRPTEYEPLQPYKTPSVTNNAQQAISQESTNIHPTHIQKTSVKKENIQTNNPQEINIQNSDIQEILSLNDQLLKLGGGNSSPLLNNQAINALRLTLEGMRDKRKIVSSSTHTSQAIAPNSPPVKVLNTANPQQDLAQYLNTISIGGSPTPQSSRPGIRHTLSNIFSRMIGRQEPSPPAIIQKERDQFVQIVMPSPNSNAMEQITIPLPKPIHYTFVKEPERPKRQSDTNPVNSLASLFSLALDTRRSRKENEINKSSSSDVEVSPFQNIIERTRLPNMVKQKLVGQMNSVPTFKMPMVDEPDMVERMDHAHESQIDRMDTGAGGHGYIDRMDQIDRGDKHKEKKKAKLKKYGKKAFKYEIPPPTVIDYPIPPHPVYGTLPNKPMVIVPDPYGLGPPEMQPKGAASPQGRPPLIDISILADVVALSKIGKDNESFKFPKVGDPRRFIEIRDKYMHN